MRFFLFKDGQQIGPLEEESVRDGLLSGEYSEGTPALIEGETEWKILGAILQHRDEPPPQFSAGPPFYSQPATDAPVQIDSLILFGKVLPWLALVSSIALFLGGTIVLSGIASAVVIFETCRAGNIHRRWAYTLCGLFPVVGVFTLILLRLKVDGILREHGKTVHFLMDKVPRTVAYGILGLLCIVGWDLRLVGIIPNRGAMLARSSGNVVETLAPKSKSPIAHASSGIDVPNKAEAKAQKTNVSSNGPVIHGFHLGMLYSDFVENIKQFDSREMTRVPIDVFLSVSHLTPKKIQVIALAPKGAGALGSMQITDPATGKSMSATILVAVYGSPEVVVFMGFENDFLSKMFNIDQLSFDDFCQSFIDAYDIPQVKGSKVGDYGVKYLKYSSPEGWDIQFNYRRREISVELVSTPRADERGFGR